MKGRCYLDCSVRLYPSPFTPFLLHFFCPRCTFIPYSAPRFCIVAVLPVVVSREKCGGMRFRYISAQCIAGHKSATTILVQILSSFEFESIMYR